MKKIGIILLGLVFLAGCSGVGFNQKAQLQGATSTLKTQVAVQSNQLALIDADAAAFPSTFQKAYAKDNRQTFDQTGPVNALIQRRTKAYKRLESAQTAIETATTTLTKASSQQTANLPTATLTDTLNSLKLAKLDHKTFDAYYREMTSAETAFFAAVAKDPSDTAAINAALGRLNEYSSSLSQQAEIVQANLQMLSQNVATLSKAVDKMK
ncbi:hypothetical protein [Lacticaseibacillus hegangensis]|uniref:Cell-wall binding lipoprotein n=1 Tax=Lacticaseibacillus hegangensis TaxID=2486010 RepID=A0ABW4CXH7_9LACO|nr:hypothetical protein [Lacticaseibacillus hegangensis]